MTVFGDRDRLMQLFNNLLENSLRYTDSGGGLHQRRTTRTHGVINLRGFRSRRK
jgi:signal transduction histidine kinase